MPIAGDIVARDRAQGDGAARTGGLVRIGYRVQRLYPNDTWTGKRVDLHAPAVHGRHRDARSARDPSLFSGPQTVRSAGRSVTFRSSDAASLTVPLRPRGGV